VKPQKVNLEEEKEGPLQEYLQDLTPDKLKDLESKAKFVNEINYGYIAANSLNDKFPVERTIGLRGLTFALHNGIDHAHQEITLQHLLLLDLDIGNCEFYEVDANLFLANSPLSEKIVDTILRAARIDITLLRRYGSGPLAGHMQSPVRNKLAQKSPRSAQMNIANVVPSHSEAARAAVTPFSYVSQSRMERFLATPHEGGINVESFEVFLDVDHSPGHPTHILHAVNNMVGDTLFMNLQQYINIKSLFEDIDSNSLEVQSQANSFSDFIDITLPRLIHSHGRFLTFVPLAIYEQSQLERFKSVGSNTGKFLDLLVDSELNTEFLLIYQVVTNAKAVLKQAAVIKRRTERPGVGLHIFRSNAKHCPLHLLQRNLKNNYEKGISYNIDELLKSMLSCTVYVL